MGRILSLAALLLTGFLGGCASQDAEEDPNRVSTIPWNRPESWEGQGPLGSMMNQESR
ncbi:MAG TPA: hypothetical protein VFG14_12290 [Chthoniobacteraceae bacterium]|jgi:hypothetical protein|nr:hypothetical protein [Chthoniobacteraceae bacterium]